MTAEPAAVATEDEAAVNSGDRMQEEDEVDQTADLKVSETNNGSFSVLDTASYTVDRTTADDKSSEIQKVSKPAESAVHKDDEDGPNEMLNESTSGKDMEDSRDKAQTESILDKDSEDGHNEVLTKSVRDEAVENDMTEVATADRVEEDTSPTEPDDVGKTADSVEMEANDSGADEMSEELFLSPAASEPDTTTTDQPTAEADDAVGGSGPWLTKVPPLFETEPPALDSDYEEAVLCDTEETPKAVHRNSGELKEENSDAKLDGESNASNLSTPAAATSVKPKPM